MEEDNVSHVSSEREQSIDLTLDKETIRDPCYHKVKLDRPSGRKKTIEFYETPCVVGATIRNPITGVRMYGHKVGSRDEDLYFKVVFTAHPPTSKGTHTPCHLYYESPCSFTYSPA